MTRAFVMTLTVCLSFAQTSSPAFEVVSIKHNASDGDRAMPTSLTPGRYRYPNATVFGLLRTAFGVAALQISGGPGWIHSDRYDINATVDSQRKLDLAELRPMLQTMLRDRFKLQVRRETQELPLYALVAAKNGAKLVRNTGPGEPSQLISGNSSMLHLKCTKMSMARLAATLQGQFGSQFGRTVIDDTGLKGDFDFTVSWATDQSADSAGISIVEALQEQLGLRLESRRGPVEIIHIDSIEKPSEN